MYYGRWAWAQVSKEGADTIKLSDMARLSLQYPHYVSKSVCVTDLIKTCDKNCDGDLETCEIQELLAVSNDSIRDSV